MSKGFFINNKQLEKIIEDAESFIKKNKYELSYSVKIAIKNNLGDLDAEDWSTCFRKAAGEIKKRMKMEEYYEKNRTKIDSKLRELEMLQRAKELRQSGDPEYSKDEYAYLSDINFKLSEELIKGGGDIVRYSQMSKEPTAVRGMTDKGREPKRGEATRQRKKGAPEYIQGKIDFK